MVDLSPALTHIGGPTVLMRYAGLTVVSDPTFDPPGSYPLGELVLEKTAGPRIPASAIGEVDLVLLSHDQHPDNLDAAGREVVAGAKRALSTPEAAGRMDGVEGLADWESVSVESPGGPVTITAVPARHGPPGCKASTGTVTGFWITCADQPTVYVSGDNAALELIDEISALLGEPDVAVLHLGWAQFPGVGGPVTMGAVDALAIAELWPDAMLVPVHADSWTHFGEDYEVILTAFLDAGIARRLPFTPPE